MFQGFRVSMCQGFMIFMNGVHGIFFKFVSAWKYKINESIPNGSTKYRKQDRTEIPNKGSKTQRRYQIQEAISSGGTKYKKQEKFSFRRQV